MNRKSMRDILLSGGSIEFKNISICFLPDYFDGIVKRPLFQVYANHHKLNRIVKSNGIFLNERISTELYASLNSAIDKFLGLKEFLYGKSKTYDNSQ